MSEKENKTPEDKILNEKPSYKKKVKKNKCSFCKKKLGMIYFDCECGGKFCSIHRYTHTHNCKCITEKKEKNIKSITDNNPTIQFQKFTKV